MMQKKSFLYYPHKKQYRCELSQKVSFCFKCESAIITDGSGNELSTIKPLKYQIPHETTFPIFLTIPDNHEPYYFLNKSGYIKIRKEIIKSMKEFCMNFKLNKKTFFLALDYFDRICSKMMAFDKDALKQTSQICIIIACKLQENQSKGMKIKKLASAASVNYAKDELFVMNLLNHDLHTFTSYDILLDIMNCGFLFNNEIFSEKKMNSIYGKIENILYLFSESKFYIDMTNKERAIAIIGFIREILGLTAFSKSIQIVFMKEYGEIHNYLNCLSKLRKCFKLKVDNNANNNSSDSNTEANSDNNSDNASENDLSDNKKSKKNKTKNHIDNNSIKKDN